jgi:hypothetical protein
MKFFEYLKQFLGTMGVEVEGTVEHPYILNAMLVNGLYPFVNGAYGEHPYRFLATADTKGTSIETASCRFQLYKRLAPIKECARFGRFQSVELHDSGYAVVAILVVFVDVT